MFNIGQEVICVDGEFNAEQIKRIPNRPLRDKIYTIRDCFRQKGVMVVLLKELVNPQLPASSDTTSDGGYGLYFEPNFRATRFAPLVPDLVEENEKVTELSFIL